MTQSRTRGKRPQPRTIRSDRRRRPTRGRSSVVRGIPYIAAGAVVAILLLLLLGGDPRPISLTTPNETPTGSPRGFVADRTTVTDCDPVAIDCLAQAYGNIAYREGADAAFVAIRQADPVTVASVCHRVVYRIGAAAAARAGDQPASAITAGRTDCLASYFSGVLRHLFAINEAGDDAIAQIGAAACDQVPSTERALHISCLRGIGQAALMVRNYQIPDALEVCTTIGIGWAREWCYSGVYIEQTLPTYDAPRRVDITDRTFPCTPLGDGEGKSACYQAVVVSTVAGAGGDPSGAAEICAATELAYRFACFATMGTQVPLRDAAAVGAACALANDYAPTCIYGALRYQTAQDQSVVAGAALCGESALGISRELCLQAIGSGLVGLVDGPEAARRACDTAFEQTEDRVLCLVGATRPVMLP